MTTAKVTTNAAQVKTRMKNRGKAAENEIKRLLVAATDRVHATVINGISKQGRGRWYGKHQASAAGDYPATDLKGLRMNMSKQMDLVNKIGRVTSSANYSKHLEYGTVNMAPSPFMVPSLEKNRAILMLSFRDAGLLRKGGKSG